MHSYFAPRTRRFCIPRGANFWKNKKITGLLNGLIKFMNEGKKCLAFSAGEAKLKSSFLRTHCLLIQKP
jgi:hypothetical protein